MSTQVENIYESDFGKELSDRYLAYALSSIMSRSLPDVRDGLKPVHRRLLYAMIQLRLDPKAAYKKCARVVGDVIGKYHPHGEAAVYETLVRLAQDFSLRYPLVEGQGNFGSIDGDNAAAMRYTESRLTDIAMYLVKDMESETVDFKNTYDGSETEPTLFPSAFPNLLANGSEGIAVGMATSIPPHNLHELCDGLIYLLDHPDAQVSELVNFIKGPDFPTGGTIIEDPVNIIKAYETGRGGFRLRARWHKEELVHGLYQIIISEIPYQVQKSRLIENMADLIKEKKLPLIGNLRDESTEEVRIIIDPKNRSVDANVIMEALFKLTELEVKIPLNLNVIDSNSVPRVLNLKEVLEEFLNHRRIVVTKRSKFLLNNVNTRLETLEGYKKAYLNLDEVIRIIREEDDAKEALMLQLDLSDMQAESILNMRLRSLRRLEEKDILKEIDALLKEKTRLNKILNDKESFKKELFSEISEIQKKFGFDSKIGKRRTDFEVHEQIKQIIDITAFIEKEPITVICSKMGWLRAVKGHISDFSSIKYKEGDEEKFFLHCSTTDKIIIFTKFGKFYTLFADNLQKGKGLGESLRILVDIDNKDDITAIIKYEPNEKYLVAASNGKGFIVSSEELLGQTRNGRQILTPADKHEAVILKKIVGDSIAIIGENRKFLIFKLDEIPVLKKGQGVILQKYTQARIADLKIFNLADGLSWKLGDKVRLETDLTSWFGRRGGTGKLPPVGFPKNNKFA